MEMATFFSYVEKIKKKCKKGIDKWLVLCYNVDRKKRKGHLKMMNTYTYQGGIRVNNLPEGFKRFVVYNTEQIMEGYSFTWKTYKASFDTKAEAEAYKVENKLWMGGVVDTESGNRFIFKD